MKKYFFILIAMLTFVSSVFGNNVRMAGVAEVTDVNSGIATIKLSLKWDNSWRDSYNWDAVWVFLKYKSVGGAWGHVNLEATGHTFTSTDGNDYTCFPGKNGNTTVGLFVLLSEATTCNPSLTCELKWKLPVGLTKASFDDNNAFLFAQGIEMVYIPYGAYQLGEKGKVNAFDSVFIDSELAKSGIPIHSGSSVNLSATYPKGFGGFHMMKYETSQEQYITFLNTLTLIEQQAMIPNHASLEPGNYVFGSDRSRPSFRNGIILSQKSDGGKPMVFDNNLTVDEAYGQDNDGKCLPCNYMSVNAMKAYCSWSGLRPMSELEFEKACRLPFPSAPAANEYVWNSVSSPVFSSTFSNNNTPQERPSSGQVNAGGVLDGPIRCGSFAAKKAGQQSSGSTYWGVMELGGNLREIYASVKNTSLTSSSSNSHGDGSYSISSWGTTLDWFGYRGGSFESPKEKLQTSDRSEMSLITSLTASDSVSGFRGVRTLSSDGVTINAGTIALSSATICPGSDVTINSTDDASVDGMSGIPFTYIWYISEGNTSNYKVQESTDASLDLHLVQGVTYYVKRKAICMLGEKEALLTISVPAMSFTISPTSVLGGSPATASVTSYSYSWTYNGVEVGADRIYTPKAGDFNASMEGGDFIVQCEASFAGCESVIGATQDLAVTIVGNCGDLVYAGQTYSTVTFGDQCWMAENLNVGEFSPTRSESNYWRFDDPGIQKYCIQAGNGSHPGVESNCAIYGGLYEWWEMICGGYCSGGNVTPANAERLTISDNEAGLAFYGAKMVPGSNNLVQGICPNGWHIPTDSEWTALAKIQPGFNFKEGGHRGSNGSGFYYLASIGFWWSSTPDRSSFAWRRTLYSTTVGTVINRDTNYTRLNGFSVRCVRN